MVKKVTKLSDEEIEEHRNENYQMMAAIAGKSVSELIDENPKRGNYGEKDCLVKQMFLKNLVEPITSRRLFETLKKQGYDAKYTTFCGLLNRYQKYGYIEKKTSKKPFLFGLTSEGLRHAKNPYLAREELARKRMEFVFSEIEKQLAEHPEALKNLVETISGMNIGTPIGSGGVAGTPVSGGNQYSNNDLGSMKEELESRIFDKEFWKNSDNEKLKSLVDDLLDPCLPQEEKEQLLIDALDEARNTYKGSMILQKQYIPSKPVGERKYYSILANSINHPVTKSLYDAIPFRFMRVGKEIRLKSRNENGLYRNNKDGNELKFDEVNRQYFQNIMTIKTKPNPEKRELEFYYVGGNFGCMITTMSYDDYEKAKNKHQPTLKLKINT